ncbi:MAG TPA: caspase family protein, partial [Myxococcaceae bacterium]|nr:caspase family protein [Myxococcaceae bacterium]
AFLVDTSSRVRGHAFVTSSSADEVAQESDRIGASFFTHFLLTGLRGAADVTRDGRVTLNEAYQFAFNETLARTERTRGGPQHPAYDIQLVGSGDIVMTDLRGTPAGIRMSPELSGRVFLRTEQGQLVAELNKISGHALELGLEPGRYQVTVEREGQLRTAHLEVTPGRTARLELTQLVPITPEVTASRGSSGQPDLSIPLAASLIPGFSTNGRREAEVTNNLTIGLVSRAAGLQGFGLTIVGSVITRRVAGIQLSGGLNSSGDLRGLQIAGGVNGVGWGTPPSKATGWQLATIANSVRGRVTGAQTALGFNGVSERVNGAQFAGVNLVGSELRGLQLGGANLVPHAAGVQLGGLNAAQRVHGVQAGAVNASATVRGLQIGAVNIAEDADATFGLINLVKNGYNHLAFWGSETNPGNVGLKYGGTHLYALLTAGLRPGPVPDRRYSFGFGFGGHIPVRAFFVDIEALASQVHHPDIRFKDEADNLLSTFRVSVGWQAFRHFAVFAGPSLNVFYVSDRETYRGDVGGGRDLMDQDEAVLCIFPGFQLGMQI